MMNPPPLKHARVAESALKHALGGVSYVLKNRRLRTLFTLFCTVGIFGWSYAVLMPAYARDIMRVNETGYGMLMSASGLGALIGALINAAAGHLIPKRQLVFGGVYLFSAMLILFATTGVYPLALIFLAIGSCGFLLFMATCNTLIQTSVPDDMRGRVMGVWALVFGGMVPIGSLEAGTLARLAGVRWTIASGAGIAALAAFITWLTIRNRLPSGSATAEASTHSTEETTAN